jgi:hypothetical protein
MPIGLVDTETGKPQQRPSATVTQARAPMSRKDRLRAEAIARKAGKAA